MIIIGRHPQVTDILLDPETGSSNHRKLETVRPAAMLRGWWIPGVGFLRGLSSFRKRFGSVFVCLFCVIGCVFAFPENVRNPKNV